jgi:hypothetical protein
MVKTNPVVNQSVTTEQALLQEVEVVEIGARGMKESDLPDSKYLTCDHGRTEGQPGEHPS